MKPSIAIVIEHAEILHVVHVNHLNHMGIGVFGGQDLHPFALHDHSNISHHQLLVRVGPALWWWREWTKLRIEKIEKSDIWWKSLNLPAWSVPEFEAATLILPHHLHRNRPQMNVRCISLGMPNQHRTPPLKLRNRFRLPTKRQETCSRLNETLRKRVKLTHERLKGSSTGSTIRELRADLTNHRPYIIMGQRKANRRCAIYWPVV